MREPMPWWNSRSARVGPGGTPEPAGETRALLGPTRSCVVACALIAFGLGSNAWASGIVRSPFLPSNFGEIVPAPAADRPADRWELCGGMSVGGSTLLTFFDPAENRTIRGELNETLENGVRISELSSSPEDFRVFLEGPAGWSRWVPLRKGGIAPSHAPAPVPPAANAATVQKLSDVRQQIEARRTLRRQMIERAARPDAGSVQP